jgi:methylated-DNA-[protein]-cysteine S-methyltransferase
MCSYLDVAVKLGNPNAVRAVGLANGQNRVAILVPCHRVIDKSGRLRGYGGGLERKKFLLELEGAIQREGVLYSTVIGA